MLAVRSMSFEKYLLEKVLLYNCNQNSRLVILSRDWELSLEKTYKDHF